MQLKSADPHASYRPVFLLATPRYILYAVDKLLLRVNGHILKQFYLRTTSTPLAEFIVPDWGYIIDSGIGLTLSPQSGTMN